ncbi:PucR family transcriptional regulator [Actinocorallia sp. A-T 12471]|uniref:PucR family transcriptional regulator n=1 Tax=Actinocorallia sp. A-T 12471 TaxID=3089813 RepID=UPI0029CD4DE1|nr:PucR family transcriptional regulator ligand-binding domain-containing protein [Actinocorallia sp. A-T 12471]MDX6743542.1 PucR family transcriptional regulator ligand-binding domain-containing protein [Actinocorallia sp. A-T 12471]
MQLRDVLEQPGRSLPVLIGEQQLDRPLRSSFTTDLLDPGRYLVGGEMVLTGLMWRRDPSDSEVFVENLARAGIAALGAGEGLLGSVPEDLVEACRRHAVPLFAVPADVSFREITERMATVLWAEREAAALAARSRHRGLIAALTSGATLREVWPTVHAWTIGSSGRILAGGRLPEARRLATAFLSADRLPAAATVDGRLYRIEGLPGVPRLGGRFVASVSPEGMDELVSLAALDLARTESARQVERRLAAQLVAALAAEENPAAALRACGLDPDAGHLVLVGSLTAGPAGALLEELTNGAVAELDGTAVAVVPDAPGLLAELREDVHRTSVATRVTVGVSRAARAQGLAAALTEARHAHSYALERPGRSRVVSCDELASHDLLLAGIPATARQAFADRLLEPLVDYDARNGSELLRTLEAFLACDGSWTRCASVMHVHVNTLRYRMRRIADLTGRDLDLFSDRVDFHLALRLRR